ncbi:uncharacterized protein LOC117289435 [Asterias rubens]|uniref:uncharacterized protein LOC117289435 n=1 Tax=Asterias rubens TaxID=7604 RepID=UPI0014555D7C|nr:uncharacterized protein LOC117289435 [Asterias rubens]
MPWCMEQALSVQPPGKHRNPDIQAELNRRCLNTCGLKLWCKSRSKLPPIKIKIFTKLLENSQRMFGDPEMKLACMYDRLVLAGRGTPVDKELLTAPTCCRFHWLQYQSGRRQLIGAVMPYEDPFQPPTLASKTLRNIGKADQLTRRVRHDLRNNARVQATIATINVRWHNMRKDPGYDTDSLYSTLGQYGDIVGITMTSPLSARVEFCQLQAACNVVEAHTVGYTQNPLLCLWYHKSMKNKAFYVKRRHLHVTCDPFAT